jgi:peptide deformylase
MAILKIARMGHPVLLARAREIEDPTAPEVRRLAHDMVATMLDAEGIGLAAPQVHVPRRLIVILDAATRDEAAAASAAGRALVLVNPEIEVLDGGEPDALDWEGCLSIPGLRGIVPRHGRVRYRALGLDGAPIEREVEGLPARVVQHEVDHLDGVLYPMRMSDLRLLTFDTEMKRLAALLDRRQGDEEGVEEGGSGDG